MKQLIIKLIPFKAQTLPIIFKCLNVASKIRPQKKELLFVFAGRSYYWKNMGIELFENEPSFKNSILQSDAIIQKIGEPSILQNFSKDANEDFFQHEINVLNAIAAIQIAVYDCFEVKNILPNAIAGMSLGEVTGIYAANGITKQEVFKILQSIKILSNNEKKEYISVFFKLKFKDLKKISEKFNTINPVYEADSNFSVALIDKNTIEKTCKKLTESNISYTLSDGETLFPYHTQSTGKYKDLISKRLENLEFKPLKCDYYSAALGKIVPKGTILSNEFWYNFQRDPVLANKVFDSIRSIGKTFKIVQIGQDLFGRDTLLQRLSNGYKKSELYSTLRNHNTSKLLTQTINKIKKDGLRNSRSLKKNTDADAFLQNFNLHNPYFIENPYPFWEHLNKNGNILFVPSNNCWLVSKYDEIKDILGQPENFSSKSSSFFDPYLIGADPPDHKVMRSMLQPLFSQKSLKRIENFVITKSEDLANGFPKGTNFNFADYFSLPLSKSVTGFFLGLDAIQLEKVHSIVRSKIYEVNEELKNYFSELLESDFDFNPSSALYFLKKQFAVKKLTLDAASSIARLLWMAGILTTSILLSNVFFKLFKNPSLIKSIEESDQLANKFIDECLRLLPPETMLFRTTTKEVRISDKTIPENAMIAMDLRAGNYDKSKFDNPNKISLTRTSNSHLSFGSGPHVCIGMALAKLEVKIALKLYIDIIKEQNVTIIEPFKYYASSHFRGFEVMNVYLSKTNSGPNL